MTADRIAHRARDAGLTVSPALVEAAVAYLALLAKWNAKINLTAFPLTPPTDEAIDRLILEPLAAARHVPPAGGVAIDIGSGGGSPAIPLALACPSLRFVLVESKSRKSAFLREAIRSLSLNATVETCRVEDVRADLRRSTDLVTVRAVRADTGLWLAIHELLKPSGRVLWFGGRAADAPRGFHAIDAETVVGGSVTVLDPPG